MEGAGPRQCIGHHAGSFAHRLPRDPFNPLYHFRCRSARKRHEQYASRVDAADDQMCDLVSQRVRLAGAGAGNDQKRISRGTILLGNAMFDGATLFPIKVVKVGSGR